MISFKEFLNEGLLSGFKKWATHDAPANRLSMRPARQPIVPNVSKKQNPWGDVPKKGTKPSTKDPNTIHLPDQRQDKPMPKKHQFHN